MEERILVEGFLHNDNKVLLLKRKEDKKFFPGHYELPGGHKKSSESDEMALKREVLEETGLHVNIGEKFFSYSDVMDNARYIVYAFIIITQDNISSIRTSPEHELFEWVEKDRLDTLKIDGNERQVILKGFEAAESLLS